MSACDCYKNGACLGTPELALCGYNGNPEKCHLKHPRSVLNTAEMWLEARKNPDKIFEIVDGDIAYSVANGMTDKFDFDEQWSPDSFSTLDELMFCEWREMSNIMTRKEAEERYGIKIIG